MTNDEKAKKVVAMLSPEEVSESDVLPYLIISEEILLNRLYPYRDISGLELPSRYDMVHCHATVELWNHRGAEGQTAHSENGISRTWASSILSPSLIYLITPFVGSVVETHESAL